MSSGFQQNPRFIPQVEAAVIRGLDDLGDAVVTTAARRIAPFSSGAAAAVHKDPATRGAGGLLRVVLHIGRGLGNIFEFSKEQHRITKGRGPKRRFPAGLNRGVMQRREFFNVTVEEMVRRGISLRRYL